MWTPDRPPLPEWIQDVYETIVAHVDDPDEGLPRERARELLLAQDEFTDDSDDIEYAIDRLLDRGWFYEVDGDLRVTDPESEPSKTRNHRT